MGVGCVALGPAVIKQIHDRIVAARPRPVTSCSGAVCASTPRWSRPISTIRLTVPLLGDGVRVLTRTMKKYHRACWNGRRQAARPLAQRDAQAARDWPGSPQQRRDYRERLQCAYGRLLETTGRVVRQAERFSPEIGGGVKCCTEIVEQAML